MIGYPDNIRLSDHGTFLVGITTPRFRKLLPPFLDLIAPYPAVKRLLAKVGSRLQLKSGLICWWWVRTSCGVGRWFRSAGTTSCCRATLWPWSWGRTVAWWGHCTTPKVVWRGRSATSSSTEGGRTWAAPTCPSCRSWRERTADPGPVHPDPSDFNLFRTSERRG